ASEESTLMAFAFLRKLFHRKAKPVRSAGKRRSDLILEILEDRVLLHATVSATILGPSTASEGQAIALVGNASSSNPVAQVAGFDYTWIIKDQNGLQVAARSSASAGFYAPDNFAFTPPH